MSVPFSEEREQLREVIRGFLADSAPESAVRVSMTTESGWDPAVWSALAEEIGVLGLGIPEEFGGAGYGIAEIAVIAEEAGRALLCAPYLATVAASQAVLATGDRTAAADLLPDIAAGSTIATLAVTEVDGRFTPEAISTVATADGAGWRLSGTKMFVLDGTTADLILVAARTDEGIGLFAVDATAPGLRRTALATLDQTRRQARLDLTEVPGRLVGERGAAWPAIEHAVALAIVVLAAEQVGGADRVLAMAVDYAKTRVQFGRAIGSFQSIKHKCADVLVEVESAKSAAFAALGAAAAQPGTPEAAELPLVASIAKAYCSDAYVHAAAENIQIHGGIGFTWEHPAHLYFKRAKSSRVLFGDPADHRERVAQLI